MSDNLKFFLDKYINYITINFFAIFYIRPFAKFKSDSGIANGTAGK